MNESIGEELEREAFLGVERSQARCSHKKLHLDCCADCELPITEVVAYYQKRVEVLEKEEKELRGHIDTFVEAVKRDSGW